MTIAEVAEQAGVSVPTVSKVLNGRADVAGPTRERVRQAIAHSGYRKRKPAAPRRTGLIDLVLDRLDSFWAMEVLRGAEAEARRTDRQVVLGTSDNDDPDSRAWLDRLAARGTDGVVVVVGDQDPETTARLAALEAPVVLLDPVGGSDPAFATVGATNWAGAFSAVEHLTSLGHRRIGVISGPPRLSSSQQRVDGYRAALRRSGIAADEDLVRFGDFLVGGGHRGATALLDLPEPPTAIFAGSDMQAVGVYQEAARRGLRVPADLSVVGFDDISLCEYLRPSLSTVLQPLARMAAEAVRLALDGSGPDTDGRVPRLELATDLVVRESTAPPPP
ncbi:substrate-binding domain-containing protein [Pseudonocardia sp. KRD291]|uniref:LacI family DNA-binding transcriptional regulator n=1 Tax=Pseudonocardia sp. KRD291 TaxID=2792007 RepID=UPI0027E31408|nr:substrate-binding domain-containing protein [Pseudonocardia sp. KRD291]